MTTDDDGARRARPSGPGETAEATPPTIDWPAWLEEYRVLAQAEWETNEDNENVDRDASQRARRILERAREDATDRLEEFVATIAGAEGSSLEALAVKLAVEWSHVIDFPDLTAPMDSEQLLIRTSLDYLADQTGLDLFVCHDRNGQWLLGRSGEPPEDDPDTR